MAPSSVAKVEPEVGYKIDYTPSTAKKKALDRALDGSQPGAMPVTEIRTGPASKTAFQAPDADELTSMLAELHLTGDKAIVLSVTPEYCQHFVDQTPAVVAPKSFLRFRNAKCDGKTLDELIQYCAGLKNRVAITPEEAEKMERLTRQQADCHYWHHSRAGRITASNLHNVVARHNESSCIHCASCVLPVHQIPESASCGVWQGNGKRSFSQVQSFS
jgi:NAD-dependent dihydropyrimidine dehydrogenase PreA subunit